MKFIFLQNKETMTRFSYIYTEDGNKEMFDLSSLGKRKYNELIEDLGVVGVKSKTIKLNDVNKNN